MEFTESNDPIFDLETLHDRLTNGIAMLTVLSDALNSSIHEPAEYAGAVLGMHDHLTGISDGIIDCIHTAYQQRQKSPSESLQA